MSRHEDLFAKYASPSLASWFGRDPATELTVYIEPGATNATPVKHTLRWVTVGDEARFIDRDGPDVYVKFVRECWAIVDPVNPNYCGVQDFKIGGKINLGIVSPGPFATPTIETQYNIERVTGRDGAKIVDFRISRYDLKEMARQGRINNGR